MLSYKENGLFEFRGLEIDAPAVQTLLRDLLPDFADYGRIAVAPADAELAIHAWPHGSPDYVEITVSPALVEMIHDNEELATAWRAAAYVGRETFLLRMFAAGHMTGGDVTTMAAGNLPAIFDKVVQSYGNTEAVEMRVKWPTVTRVKRNDQIVDAIATTLKLSAEQMDDVFTPAVRDVTKGDEAMSVQEG